MVVNVLVIGSGAREHALCWKLRMSSLLSELYIAPGNPGTIALAKHLDIHPSNFEAISAAIKNNTIDMLVIGPEQPLVNGLVDFIRKDSELNHIRIIGPDSRGAQLEGSKAFSKKFMEIENIPTASYFEITKDKLKEGIEYLSNMSAPYVLKADGLAAGKGVIITSDLTEAKSTLANMLNGQFGEASDTVIIESFLEGIEFSVFALVNGLEYVMLPSAKDYKRIGEGDTGPNTGGMGAISPVPFYDEALSQKVKDRIINPTIEGLVKAGIHYQGFIFFGLINCNGNPYVIEYNCRLGDPETQVILPRLQNDLLDLFLKFSEVNFSNVPMSFSKDFVANVVLASGGYPDSYNKGYTIDLNSVSSNDLLFQAGTSMHDNILVTHGGRVISCCAKSNALDGAISKALDLANRIQFTDKVFRRDIGMDLM